MANKVTRTMISKAFLILTALVFLQQTIHATDCYNFTKANKTIEEDTTRMVEIRYVPLSTAECELQDSVVPPQESMPQFRNGGVDGLKRYLKDNTRYPEIGTCLTGSVRVQFIINKDGSVTNPKVIRGLHPLFDKEAIKVIQSLPPWIPAIHQGKPTKMTYLLSIDFTPQDSLVYGYNEKDLPDIMPNFPGGAINMLKYFRDCVEQLREKLNIPMNAWNGNGVAGRTIIQFIIEKDGKATHLKVLRGVDPKLDKEALNFVNEMPRWKPGSINGKPVRVIYTIPVSWILQ